MGILKWAAGVIMEDFRKQLAKKMQLEYIGGLPGFRGKRLQLASYRGGVKINGRAAQIMGVQWQEQHERSVGKAAAGAILGSFVAPVAGTIIGAAIGGRKSDSSLAVIQAAVEGSRCTIYVRCSENEFRDLASF